MKVPAIDRRKFLAFLGVGAAAGPAAVKSAAELTMADTHMRGLGLASGVAGAYTPAPDPIPEDRVSWAKGKLKQFVSGSRLRNLRRQQFWMEGLDPETASLRSMSLQAKVRRSRDIQFELSERKTESYLRGIVRGWWE